MQHLSDSDAWSWKFNNFLWPSQADFEFKVKNRQEQRTYCEDLKPHVVSHVLPAGFPSTSSRRLAVEVAVPNLETSFVKNTKPPAEDRRASSRTEITAMEKDTNGASGGPSSWTSSSSSFLRTFWQFQKVFFLLLKERKPNPKIKHSIRQRK